MLIIVETIKTIAEVQAARPEHIYYGANTCWWTHDFRDVSHTPAPSEREILRVAEMFRANSLTKAGPIEPFLERARKALQTAPGLPCDPAGGVLFYTDDIDGFFQSARVNESHYGKHGLRAFMAAHHSNSFKGSAAGLEHWCSPNWKDYNDALDRLDATK